MKNSRKLTSNEEYFLVHKGTGDLQEIEIYNGYTEYFDDDEKNMKKIKISLLQNKKTQNDLGMILFNNYNSAKKESDIIKKNTRRLR